MLRMQVCASVCVHLPHAYQHRAIHHARHAHHMLLTAPSLLLSSPPCAFTPGRLPGRSLLQRLRANDRVCRGRTGRDCKGTGNNGDSTLNQQLWAQTAAIQNTLAATEWAATQGPPGAAAAVTRYNNAQLNCISSRDWACQSILFGRKLLRGWGATAAAK